MTAVAARARGLLTRVLAPELLAELEQKADVAAFARARVPADAEQLERFARERVAADLDLLGRRTRDLDALVLDEDRRSLRAIVRGLAAGAPASRRLASAVATPRLSARLLDELAAATSLGGLAELLARARHPFAPVFAQAALPIDLLALEIALAHRFGELVRRRRDPALRVYLEQLVDAENAGAAIALAERGAGVASEPAFLPGGRLLDRATFVAAAGAGHARLARAFAGTPIARALFAPEPSALEDATLAWQLSTQARLRRLEPLSLAPAIYTVLRRRDEARHLRRAAWRLALGGSR